MLSVPRPDRPQAPRHDAAGEGRPPPEGFSGHEAISRSSSSSSRCIAENAKKVSFDAILGQKVTVHLQPPGRVERDAPQRPLRPVRAGGAGRDLHALPGGASSPRSGRLTRKAQSRIFQQHDRARHPEEGPRRGSTSTGSSTGRTSRATTASSTARPTSTSPAAPDGGGGDLLLLQARATAATDGRRRHARRATRTLPGESELIYEELEGGTRDENRIWAWEKEQEMRSGKVTSSGTTASSCPHKHLEAEALILATRRRSGKETPQAEGRRATTSSSSTTVPGEYAQRFDGINTGGRRAAGRAAEDLPGQPADGRASGWTRRRRPAVVVRGAEQREALSSPGYKFTLERHFNGDGDVRPRRASSTGVASAADYRSGEGRAPDLRERLHLHPGRRCRSGRRGRRRSRSSRGARRRSSSGRRARRSSPTSTGG